MEKLTLVFDLFFTVLNLILLPLVNYRFSIKFRLPWEVFNSILLLILETLLDL